MSDYLGLNLKLLCSHYRSIAEVCRKLAINRGGCAELCVTGFGITAVAACPRS